MSWLPTKDPVLGDVKSCDALDLVIVPRFCWQTARSLGAWTLVSCTVSPAFAFDGFEMAPPGWRPG